MPTNEEVNKYITEEVMGKCWHGPWVKYQEYVEYNQDAKWRCIKCKSDRGWGVYNPDYFTPDGWWELLRFMKSDKERWAGFIADITWAFSSNKWLYDDIEDLPLAVYHWHRERKGGRNE